MKSDSPEPAGPEPAAGSGRLDHAAFIEMHQSPEFQRLKSSFRRFVFPMTVAFLSWYLLYVVLSAYARGFMGTKVVGEINVALIFGLLQFLSTLLIAWAYERHARRKLEPLAALVVQPVVGGRPGTESAPGADGGTDGADRPGSADRPDTEEEGK
ncbi:DUF485 domain-containing protein [Actinomadura sp. 9N407]|uniref:DUF485 domain-containing protein n=1 Tax=Actinomadura sp. 9N407 TaxID=3375154 RepID=UPI0037A60C77